MKIDLERIHKLAMQGTVGTYNRMPQQITRIVSEELGVDLHVTRNPNLEYPAEGEDPEDNLTFSTYASQRDEGGFYPQHISIPENHPVYRVSINSFVHSEDRNIRIGWIIVPEKIYTDLLQDKLEFPNKSFVIPGNTPYRLRLDSLPTNFRQFFENCTVHKTHLEMGFTQSFGLDKSTKKVQSVIKRIMSEVLDPYISTSHRMSGLSGGAAWIESAYAPDIVRRLRPGAHGFGNISRTFGHWVSDFTIKVLVPKDPKFMTEVEE